MIEAELIFSILPDSVIGNTFGSESKESRFDPWLGNIKNDLHLIM